MFLKQNPDRQWCEEQLSFYFNLLNKYQTKGGQVYRVLFTNSKEEIKYKLENKDELNFGVHWFYEYDYLDFATNGLKIEYEQKTNKKYKQAWLISAEVFAGYVDVEKSINQFIEFPEEGEIVLISPAKFKLFKITPYNSE